MDIALAELALDLVTEEEEKSAEDKLDAVDVAIVDRLELDDMACSTEDLEEDTVIVVVAI